MSQQEATLTIESIRHHVDALTFGRGREYAYSKRITHARRAGDTLKADCYGSGEAIYRVQATVRNGEIVDADCSCPVGMDGECKHVVALLLTYLEQPELFRDFEDMEVTLERRSKDELIALIKQMLKQEPELEALLEIPLPQSKATRNLSPDSLRRQLRARFEQSGYRWGTEGLIATAVDSILDLGDDYVANHDWRNATTVYHTVVEEVLDKFHQFHDEGGALRMLVERGVNGLAECYSESEGNPELRKETLRALFDVYQFVVEFGGIGLGENVPQIIAEYATPLEKKQVTKWIRETMKKRDKDEDITGWRLEHYGEFLLKVNADELDNEQYIKICRETGRVQDLVERLLSLGRVNEARQDAAQASDYELVQLGDLFLKYRQGAVAEELIGPRAPTSRDTRLAEWLVKYYKSQNDNASALQWARFLFEQHPSLQHYQEMSKLARVSAWQQLREDLLQWLEKKNYFGLLTQIYLAEKNVDAALKTVEQTGTGRPPEFALDMRLAVAQAAEVTHPRDAIRLYQQCAERLIAQRGRLNYMEACKYLAQAGRLARSSGESEKWDAYIHKLDEDNRALRALREELRKARLVS